MYDIVTIPCLSDNYAYLIINTTTNDTIVVDVPECTPIYDYIDNNNLNLKHILLTHHHGDHIAGVDELVQKTGAKVHGKGNDANRLPPLDNPLNTGETYKIDDLEFSVFNSDGHTVGCISFYFAQINAVFTGDLLFTMGCGRMFEGTPDKFFASLQTIKSLPLNTEIYSGHEYTGGNLEFAKTVVDLDENYVNQLQTKIDNNIPTVPAILGDEINNNPFLIAETAEQFAEYRQGKDNF